MDNLVTLTVTAIVAFVSTNIDDLVMLIALYLDGSYRPAQIVVGQFAGIIGLIVLSLLGSLVALVVPPAYIGFIGVVPIAMGLRRLLRRAGNGAAFDVSIRSASAIGTVTLVTLANGGDNLSLYIPLFAIHPLDEIGVIVVIFLVLTAVWCVAGYALAHPKFLGWRARKWGDAVLPYVMIGLGIYIFMKTDVLAVFAR